MLGLLAGEDGQGESLRGTWVAIGGRSMRCLVSGVAGTHIAEPVWPPTPQLCAHVRHPHAAGRPHICARQPHGAPYGGRPQAAPGARPDLCGGGGQPAALADRLHRPAAAALVRGRVRPALHQPIPARCYPLLRGCHASLCIRTHSCLAAIRCRPDRWAPCFGKNQFRPKEHYDPVSFEEQVGGVMQGFSESHGLG